MHCLMGKYNFLGHCASQDIVITWLGHYVKLFSKPSAVPWALATSFSFGVPCRDRILKMLTRR